MRASYLSQDRADISEAVKCLARSMAKPREASMQELNRLARYLKGRPRCVLIYERRDARNAVIRGVRTDSDWAGEAISRKSTTGMVMRRGKHLIRHGSTLQASTSLSSAEAELYGMVEGVTRAKGLLSLASEVGFQGLSNVVHLGTDSSAAKSFVCRRGLGRMRHLEIRDLWLQKEVREGKVEVSKIRGDENPADLMTKILKVKEIKDRLGWMNIRMEE